MCVCVCVCVFVHHGHTNFLCFVFDFGLAHSHPRSSTHIVVVVVVVSINWQRNQSEPAKPRHNDLKGLNGSVQVQVFFNGSVQVRVFFLTVRFKRFDGLGLPLGYFVKYCFQQPFYFLSPILTL